mmetsp:Transcript_6550/g.9555  ORF Transcript_6550/g.9555 Transcript_6550/m.9555 type:complete len:256 (-) Transcript_6550:155-922(-)
MKQFTVSIPCDGYYCRPLVGLSLLISPLWLAMYAYMQFEINILYPTKDDCINEISVLFMISCITGICFLVFAPVSLSSTQASLVGQNVDASTSSTYILSSFISVPIALYGFAVAATWMDAIADQLVSLLTLLGLLCHIPGEIMGLTVLAIGNSFGDLTANATMARKGLVNMAITACFAGPVFSVLFGIGLAMYIWGNSLAALDLTPPLQAAVLFSVLNCTILLICGLCFGYLDKSYSYAALMLYIVYTCISLSII